MRRISWQYNAWAPFLPEDPRSRHLASSHPAVLHATHPDPGISSGYPPQLGLPSAPFPLVAPQSAVAVRKTNPLSPTPPVHTFNGDIGKPCTDDVLDVLTRFEGSGKKMILVKGQYHEITDRFLHASTRMGRHGPTIVPLIAVARKQVCEIIFY